MPAPRVSVVVPVRNGSALLGRCIHAIGRNPRDLFELIVADDGSADGSAELAHSLGARVIQTLARSGPAAARNAGAACARGDLLLFVDGDVEIQPSTIPRVVSLLDADAGLAAIFGSYDDEPHAENFTSQYRNLLHHFVHQTSRRRSASFWAGCGAIRRTAFEAVQGFDEHQYRRPAIEDIEMGLRLSRAGYAVQLVPEVQVKHLKTWTPVSMVKADILDRAYPWSKLLVAQGGVPDDLNLRWQHRLSAALVGLLAATLAFLALGHRSFYGVPATPAAVVFAILLVAPLVPLNRVFYGFLVRRRGWIFAARAVPVHFLYYFYSGLTFVACWTWFRLVRGVRPRARRAAATWRPFPDA